MALIACAECGHQVSDRAAACPQCGAPVTSQAPVASARVEDDSAPRVKTAEDNVFTRNRGCVDFVFLLPVVLLVLYGVSKCTGAEG